MAQPVRTHPKIMVGKRVGVRPRAELVGGLMPAFQDDGGYQLAEDLGYQTQGFALWVPVLRTVGGPWVPLRDYDGNPS